VLRKCVLGGVDGIFEETTQDLSYKLSVKEKKKLWKREMKKEKLEMELMTGT
jgi:hypothetical protein